MCNQKIVPLGTFCYSANLLKAIGLRRHAYPLDYAFVKPADLVTLISTRFNCLLDIDFLYPCITSGHITTAHLMYGHIFRHHNLFDKAVLTRMHNRLNRLIEELLSGCTIVLTVNEAHGDVMIKNNAQYNIAYDGLSRLIAQYNSRNRMLLVQLRYQTEARIDLSTIDTRVRLLDVASSKGQACKEFINTQNGLHLYCSRSEIMVRSVAYNQLLGYW